MYAFWKIFYRKIAFEIFVDFYKISDYLFLFPIDFLYFVY